MDTRVANISIVVAVTENNIIGRNNDIPWKLSSDLRRFKGITTDHSVIMGRRTWESIVGRLGGPLPNRTNIVVTHQTSYRAVGAEVCASLEDAFSLCAQERVAFVIGGADIYRQAFPRANRIHLTLVHAHVEGTASLPSLGGWTITDFRRFPKDARNEYDYTFVIFERTPRPAPLYLTNARTTDQWISMERILTTGVCPFCSPNLRVCHTHPIIRGTTNWVLTKNQFPYENTRVHLLLIRRTHAERLSDLTASDWTELGELVQWAEQEFGIEGGGFAMRFGNPSLNSGTVRHLHAHLLTASVHDEHRPGYTPVRVRVG